MATLFTRLHRMGASGYDKIYLETSSKVVVRPTGHSVEDDLSTIELKLEKLSASVVTSTVPEQLKAGSVAVVGDDIYIPLDSPLKQSDAQHIILTKNVPKPWS